jgi:hypothetical protein
MTVYLRTRIAPGQRAAILAANDTKLYLVCWCLLQRLFFGVVEV